MKDVEVINLPDGSTRTLLELPADWWARIDHASRDEMAACLSPGEDLDAVMDRIEIERIIRGGPR